MSTIQPRPPSSLKGCLFLLPCWKRSSSKSHIIYHHTCVWTRVALVTPTRITWLLFILAIKLLLLLALFAKYFIFTCSTQATSNQSILGYFKFIYLSRWGNYFFVWCCMILDEIPFQLSTSRPCSWYSRFKAGLGSSNEGKRKEMRRFCQRCAWCNGLFCKVMVQFVRMKGWVQELHCRHLPFPLVAR